MSEQTQRETLVFLEYNPGVLILKIQDLILDGWLVDEDRPLNQVGFYWECAMVRDSTEAQRLKDEAERGKPSRADILKKAREAKAEKKRLEQESKTE